MPIYKGTTELTKIADFLEIDHDITEVYFGDKQVFTVWAEYDNTLPAQYTANGNYLADYRIYGASGGVGDDSGTAYGYKVDMSTRSENLVDVDKWLSDRRASYQRDGNVYTFDVNLSLYNAPYFFADKNIKITIRGHLTSISPGVNPRLNLIDINGNVVKDRAITTAVSETKDIICAGFVLDYSNGGGIQLSDFEIFENTTTPIYIGVNPLGEDEYVDYGEGKIYRMSGGVLTPTDPPVPLPALPTVDGTNIVDYAGQSAAPSRFYAEYRKEGY